ncbi:zinc finger Ran-binding domain-containing protein 2-like [Neltuma alba]|uniref:zinc finger Ran-binding domain-containing protein 2-like n=1 Tax=Neltuma alba TaxID=207710 RepID=UPI0010A2FE4C|nr:zinc finger Ran-binding domain-containing protein 2-like [Prosopis alba]
MSYTGRDWLCGVCQHVNFKRRDACQRCGYPKFGGTEASSCGNNKNSEALMPGDWFCSAENCGAHNYASRSKCYRCAAFKDDNAGSDGYGLGSSLPPPGWKPGDWMCSSCGAHNYACREECFRCNNTK